MEPATQRAIEILTAIRNEGSVKLVAYFVMPNVILTLCGARSFCDGLFWNDDLVLNQKRKVDIERALAIIAKNRPDSFASVSVNDTMPGSRNVRYDLGFHDGLHYVLSQTAIISQESSEIISAAKPDQNIESLMVDAIKNGPYGREIDDEQVPHVAFGIALGYPDKAILGAVQKWQSQDRFSSQLIDADILGADYYACPQPRYQYPRSLVHDPDIRHHETMWSGLLQEYYTGDFHQSLEHSEEFMQELRELDAFYETG